jgi:hypothetical protein
MSELATSRGLVVNRDHYRKLLQIGKAGREESNGGRCHRVIGDES